MAIPTVADWDEAKVNIDRWADTINGLPTDTVQLSDGAFIKTLRGILDDLKTYNITGAWVTSTAYAVKDVAEESGIQYVALEAHTSGVFATDLAAGKWGILQNSTSNVQLTGFFDVDGGTFRVDDVNNRVGINTIAPSSALDVVGGITSSALTINTASGGEVFRALSGTTGSKSIRLGTTSGSTSDFYFGTEDSSGSFFGATAYAGVLYNSVATPIEFFTSATRRMVITGSGAIGIGTASPMTLLDIQTSSSSETPQLKISNLGSGDAAIQISNSVTDWSMGIDTSDSDKFKIGDASTLSSVDSIVIDTTGRVGIGTINLVSKLTVDQSNATGAVPVVEFSQADGDQPFFDLNGTIAADAVATISSLTTSGAPTHHLKCNISGVGTFWIPGSTNAPT